ncbi:adenylosuccinate lyase [Pelagibacteraceae bacterium]|nr:adenylosuccinate lyase [Pelagibacteraceae bacterium]
MIDRYSRKEIKKIWKEENKYQIWLDIEIAAAQAMEKLKIIPKGVSSKVKKKAKINVERIHKIENKVHHDVIAFLTSVTEKVGPEGRFLHKGMTSSDVLDTCFNIQLVQAGKIILHDIDELLKVLKSKSLKYKRTICIGRSHGIHAEPTTFGLKLLSFYEEFKRNKKRLESAIMEVSTCAISGAVGTFANVDPKIESYVAKKLSLKIEPISSQIIPRDRHAYYFSVLGIIAGSIERIATEIRNLQKTEIQEVEEYFDKKQKGSSAMPHKKNPILSENLTGLARMVRSYVLPALENISLWHERDISHSSVERNIGPDSTITLDFALNRLKNILRNINVYPKKMIKNLNITKGLIFSQRVMIELTKHGFSREKAYSLVQKNAQKAWSKNISLYETLSKDSLINKKISNKDLIKMFDIEYHTKNVNLIYKRVLK